MSTRVLVVSSCNNNRNLVNKTLKEAGFEVEVASHGLEAMEMLRLHGADLVIISGTKFTEMSGWEIRRQIKCDAMIGHIPVLITSSLYDMAIRRSDTDDGLQQTVDHRKLFVDSVHGVLADGRDCVDVIAA